MYASACMKYCILSLVIWIHTTATVALTQSRENVRFEAESNVFVFFFSFCGVMLRVLGALTQHKA